jgi:hypothetical protein
VSETGLRAILEEAAETGGLALKDLTVLAVQNDPFRVDTDAGHRDGKWLAIRFEEIGQERIHLRGLHYAILGKAKPDGTPYANTEQDWGWLQSKAAKAARWLGYIPFERITDERNSRPVLRPSPLPGEPWPLVVKPASRLEWDLEVVVPKLGDLKPSPVLAGFHAVQAARLVLFGEKTSLEAVLAPIAEDYGADLYLPTGEASDSMIHQMARTGALDGRPMVVFYLSDCDPAGWQMAVSVSRKLQALKALEFPELDFEVRPIALTPEQVRAHELPSTPLKETELRAGRWERAMGVQQTEIDALATLRPELLREIVLAAIGPFYDAGLAARVLRAESEWKKLAAPVLDAEIDGVRLEELRAGVEGRFAELRGQVAALNEELRVENVKLPDPPEVPDAEIEGADDPPLIDSGLDWTEQTKRLIAHKSYETGDAA